MRILFSLLFCAGVGMAQNGIDSVLIKKTQAEADFKFAKSEMAAFEKTHGHFITTSNGRMHYLTYGDAAKGTPLIWAGGSGMNAYELIMFGDSLVKRGFYIIAIDYYGQGQTPFPSKDVSVWHVADDMKAILDELKIRQAIVGGWSRGGTIATAFYNSYPAYVLGIVLEDGGSVAWNANEHKLTVSEIEKRTIERFDKEEPARLFDSEFDLYYSINPKKYFYRFFVLNGISETADHKWGERLGLNELYSEDNAEKKLKITLRPMDAPLYAASAQLVEPRIIYRNLRVPLLILDPVSEHDDFDFKAGNERLHNEHPDLVIHKVYENTGHALKFQKRNLFFKDMEEFLAVVKSKGKGK